MILSQSFWRIIFVGFFILWFQIMRTSDDEISRTYEFHQNDKAEAYFLAFQTDQSQSTK